MPGEEKEREALGQSPGGQGPGERKSAGVGPGEHRESDDSFTHPDEPIAPDGGWGWIILIASFFSSVIVDGVCFAFGIFYLEFLDYFKENKGKTAWIGSVLNGTYMIMGPVAGALANKFGCRAVAIAGSLWAATAFFLSTLSPNVDSLIILYGALGGMGFGLMYLPSIVIVGYYFDKKRAFATGLATCGSGIGAFVFAPMCKFLIDEYAWQGAQWIVSAIVLNGLVLGAVYRPLTFNDLERVRRKWRRKQIKLEAQRLNVQIENVKDNKSEDSISINSEQNDSKLEQTAMLPKLHQLQKNGSHPNLRMRTISTSSIDKMGSNLNSMRRIGDSCHSLTWYASSMERLHTQPAPERSALSLRSKTSQKSKLAQEKQSFMLVLKDVMNGIRETMDFSMLTNPVFVIYGLSCILCMAGFFVPFIYLPDNVIQLGYDKDKGATLLSVLGITNTVGRVAAGWISDRPWADCLVINNCALVLGGIATMFCPFCESYVLLVVYACIFGLCIACFVSLRSIILVDLIGLEKLTSAFGIIVLCQGITSFVGAPIAGSLYDWSGNYNLSFYVAGTTIALSGLICFPLRRIARWQKRREAEKLKHACAVKDSESETTSITDEIQINMPNTTSL